MKKLYSILVIFMIFTDTYSQSNTNFEYVGDLPQAPIEQVRLPEAPNLEKAFKEGFKSSLPQYKPPTREETISSIADEINNTKLTTNYTPNPLAPIEIHKDLSEYNGVELSLAEIESDNLKEIVANKKREKLTNEMKEVVNSPLGKITISLFQFCLYIVCISVLIAVVIILTGVGKKGN